MVEQGDSGYSHRGSEQRALIFADQPEVPEVRTHELLWLFRNHWSVENTFIM